MNRVSQRETPVEEDCQLLKEVGFQNSINQDINISGRSDKTCENHLNKHVKNEMNELGSQAKYGRYSTNKSKSFKRNGLCTRTKNTVPTVEFVTGDNSIQYVIKYVTDHDMSSKEQVDQPLVKPTKTENNTLAMEIDNVKEPFEYNRSTSSNVHAAFDEAEPLPYMTTIKQKRKPIDYHLHAPLYEGFTFKETFCSLAETIKKMREESDYWASFCTTQIRNQIRHFQCIYKTEQIKCPVQVLVVKRVRDEETVYLYYESSLHLHNDISAINTSKALLDSNEETDAIIISDNRSEQKCLIGDDTEDQEEWTVKQKFDSYEEADVYINNLNMLSFDLEVTTSGIKEFYRCKLEEGSAEQCPGSRYLLFENGNDEILMYTRKVTHVAICPHQNRVDSYQTEMLTVIELIESDEEANESHDVKNTFLSEQNISSDTMPDYEDWALQNEFKNLSEAEDFVSKQQRWKFLYHYKLKCNTWKYYRCVFKQCSVTKLIHQTGSLATVSVYEKKRNHKHGFIHLIYSLDAFEILDDPTRKMIKALIARGETPCNILNHLSSHVFDDSFRNELLHIIQRLYPDKVKLSTSIVQNWLITSTPSNYDSCFCVNYFVYGTAGKFRCFLSTRRLLLNAVNAKSVHFESAIAINWKTKYITFVGTTDEDGNFHLFGLAITSSKQMCDYVFVFDSIEKGVKECHNHVFSPAYLLTDDDASIHSAFLKKYQKLHSIATCPKLAQSKILKSLSVSKCPDHIKDQIQEDILKLFNLPSQSVFLTAVRLFFKEWRSFNKPHVDNFLNYLNAIWIYRISNWFEIFPQFRRDIHESIQFECDSLSKNILCNGYLQEQQFFDLIKIYVENKSCGDDRVVPTRKVPKALYEKALKWKNVMQQFKVVQSFPDRYYFSADDKELICEEKFKKYQDCEHTTLEELFDIQFKFWYLVKSKNNSFYCSCPYFLKQYICKHSVLEKFKNERL